MVTLTPSQPQAFTMGHHDTGLVALANNLRKPNYNIGNETEEISLENEMLVYCTNDIKKTALMSK